MQVNTHVIHTNAVYAWMRSTTSQHWSGQPSGVQLMTIICLLLYAGALHTAVCKRHSPRQTKTVRHRLDANGAHQAPCPKFAARFNHVLLSLMACLSTLPPSSASGLAGLVPLR